MPAEIKIVKLSTVMGLLREKFGEGEFQVSLEPDARTDEAIKAEKGGELWALRTRVAENGETVGDIGRADQKFFAVRMVLHPTFSIWQPLIDQEPASPIGQAGYRMIGAVVIPVTNMGGRDFLMPTQVTDPLGLGWSSLPAVSASNAKKIILSTDRRVPGAVRFDPNRLSSLGGVETYVRWVEPDKIPAGSDLITVRAFIDGCWDNRVLGPLAKVFEIGPLRPEYRPK